MRLRPNPPRMVTVVLSVALLAVGLALIFLPQAEAVDLVRQVSLPRDIENLAISLIAEQMIAYVCLAASPLLLIVGSLLPGI
jgi:hypothetical protein